MGSAMDLRYMSLYCAKLLTCAPGLCGGGCLLRWFRR